MSEITTGPNSCKTYVLLVFRVASRAWHAEAPVVFHLGTLVASLEVDRLGHVQDGRFVVAAVAWDAVDGVQGFAFAFERSLK